MAPPQWAYQVEHYVEEPDEELVCSICRAVFCDPTLCPCDHVFCKACISKWLENNRNCPICRKRASMTSIKQTVPIVKNLIMKLMVNCHNKSFGCKGQFSVEGSEAHVKECEYEFVQCSNKPCTDKLFRKNIVEHETKDCPHRPIRCKKCKSKLPTSSMTGEHEDCIRALRDLVKGKYFPGLILFIINLSCNYCLTLYCVFFNFSIHEELFDSCSFVIILYILAYNTLLKQVN